MYCGKFDAPSDIDEESIPEYEGRTYFSDDEDEIDDNDTGTFGRMNGRDWRSSHEDVLNKIKRDRRAYQAELNRRASGLSSSLCLSPSCSLTFVYVGITLTYFILFHTHSVHVQSALL